VSTDFRNIGLYIHSLKGFPSAFAHASLSQLIHQMNQAAQQECRCRAWAAGRRRADQDRRSPTGGMTPAHQTRPAGTMSSTDSGVGRYVTNPKRIRVFARFAHYDRSSLYDNHFRPTHLNNLG
jgi:hypothetical protein